MGLVKTRRLAAMQKQQMAKARMINDHSRGCPRFEFINSIADTVRKRRDHEVGAVDYASRRKEDRP